MPKNNSSQKASEKKSEKKPQKRSQVTQVKMGRAALRAMGKNMDRIENYLLKIHDAKTTDTLLNIEEVDKFILGRVTKAEGAGAFTVLCRDGESVKVHVSGSIAFHGRAGTKTDRPNCIIQNDVVIISGGLASAKLDSKSMRSIQETFDEVGFPYPRGFFMSAAAGEEEEDDKDCGYEFAESDDEDEKEDEKEMTKKSSADAEPELDIDTI
jgi:hypothetical protein